jgi:putative effector of murein hydrolase LrgA (UPF0299 family)
MRLVLGKLITKCTSLRIAGSTLLLVLVKASLTFEIVPEAIPTE